MAHYRCYSLNQAGSIVAAQDIFCPNDETAVSMAREIFGNDGFSVWQRSRKVYVSARAANAAGTASRTRPLRSVLALTRRLILKS
jgi:hypothetical protein